MFFPICLFGIEFRSIQVLEISFLFPPVNSWIDLLVRESVVGWHHALPGVLWPYCESLCSRPIIIDFLAEFLVLLLNGISGIGVAFTGVIVLLANVTKTSEFGLHGLQLVTKVGIGAVVLRRISHGRPTPPPHLKRPMGPKGAQITMRRVKRPRVRYDRGLQIFQPQLLPYRHSVGFDLGVWVGLERRELCRRVDFHQYLQVLLRR